MTEWQKEDLKLKQICDNCGKQKSIAGEQLSNPCRCFTELVESTPIQQESIVDSLKVSAPALSGYKIGEKLGEGGMGSVYKARSCSNGTDVAIKFMKPYAVSDRVTIKRFEQEARAVSELTHPNIAQVFDSGSKDGKEPYLLMEFVDGVSLEEILRHDRVLTTEYVLAIFSQIIDALEHAHSKGIVHRDLKPSNIIIKENRNGNHEVKLVDFGIAKVAPSPGAITELTQPGEIIGSPSYMSPEQCQGDTVDHRADIYSLGCVIFEALTGQKLFEGENAIKIVLKQINSPVKERMRLLKKPGVPGGLIAMIDKMLKKSPSQRYQSMTEIREDLDSLKSGKAPPSIKNRKKILLPVCACLALCGLLAFTLPFGSQTNKETAVKTEPQAKKDPYEIDVPIVNKNPDASEDEIFESSVELVNKGLSEKELKKLKKLLLKIAHEENIRSRYENTISEVVKMGKHVIPTLCEALKSSDRNLSRASGLVLIRFKDTAIPELVKVLKESEDCLPSIFLPMDYNGRAGLEGVSALLLDSDSEVRARAARVLRKAADYQNFSSDIRGELQLPVSGVVAQRLTNLILQDKDPSVLAPAVETLSWAYPSEQVNNALCNAIKSDSIDVKQAASASLVKYMSRQSPQYNKKPLKLLEKMIAEPGNEQSKLALLKAAKDSRDRASILVPVIRKSLSDRSNAVRLAAVEAIGSIGPKSVEALPDLIACLDDPDLRDQAAYAIAHYGGNGKSALPKLQALASDPVKVTGGVRYAIDCISGKYARKRL